MDAVTSLVFSTTNMCPSFENHLYQDQRNAAKKVKKKNYI